MTLASGKSGYTPQAIRNRNYQVIINMLREMEICSIRDLVQRSALSKTAVKRIIDNLLDAGVVCLAGKGQSSEAGGKRPELFTLCANQAYAISCIFSENGFRFVLYNLKLQVVDSVDRSGRYSHASYHQVVESIAEEIQVFLHRHCEVGDKLSCICFATAGIISYSDGILINPIHYNQWGEHIPFLADMRRLLPLSCPFYFDNALRFSAYYDQMNDPSLQEGVALMVAALGSLQEDEADGNLPCPMLGQARPVDASLIVGHVHAVHLEVAGHAHAVTLQPVAGLPAVGIGADEEPVEAGRKDQYHTDGQHVAYPHGHGAIYRLPPGSLASRSSRAAAHGFLGFAVVFLLGGCFSHTLNLNRLQS